jgi:hypothetical protein
MAHQPERHLPSAPDRRSRSRGSTQGARWGIPARLTTLVPVRSEDGHHCRMRSRSNEVARIGDRRSRRSGQQVHRSTGPQVHRSTGPQVNRSTGQQVHRSTGPQVHRSTGQQVNRSTGQQVHRSTGPQVHRSTGQQVNRSTGQQVNRPTGPESRDCRLVGLSACRQSQDRSGQQSVSAQPQCPRHTAHR